MAALTFPFGTFCSCRKCGWRGRRAELPPTKFCLAVSAMMLADCSACQKHLHDGGRPRPAARMFLMMPWMSLAYGIAKVAQKQPFAWEKSRERRGNRADLRALSKSGVAFGSLPRRFKRKPPSRDEISRKADFKLHRLPVLSTFLAFLMSVAHEPD